MFRIHLLIIRADICFTHGSMYIYLSKIYHALSIDLDAVQTYLLDLSQLQYYSVQLLSSK